jgi:hypothetical protein
LGPREDDGARQPSLEALDLPLDGEPPVPADVGQLVVLLVVGAIAGVLAGLRPARRAAKLPVLQALAAE